MLNEIDYRKIAKQNQQELIPPVYGELYGLWMMVSRYFQRNRCRQFGQNNWSVEETGKEYIAKLELCSAIKKIDDKEPDKTLRTQYEQLQLFL